VAGTVSGALPVVSPRVNLAKHQVTTSSSTNGQFDASFATDGVVGNVNSWRSVNDTDPHRLEMTFPVPVTVRSAHVYSGIDDGLVIPGFRIQYISGGSWVDAPGSVVSGNTSTERNVIFTSSVTSDRFRFYRDVDGVVRVKEFALFPPNPNPTNGVEQGYPIGTDVELNLASRRPAFATAANGTNFARLAVDGYVSSASKWQTSLVGSNSLEIDLRVTNKVGSVHLYSGDGAVAPLGNFVLQHGDGTSWTNISGGAVSGNTNTARVITFSPEPVTKMVRLVFTNSSVTAVRELCVFPANGGSGYPLGQDVVGATPPPHQFEEYNDAYYHVINRSAGLPLSVSNSQPVLQIASLNTNLAHYQVLLNVGTDSYRLRNRVTGKCLAGAGISTNQGVPLVDEVYTAMPHQQWRLVPVDATNYYLVNRWSGLAVDTQAGGTAAGTALVQAALDGGASQHWRFVPQAHFPKKGMAGFLARQASIQGKWGYNWSRTNNAALPGDVVFHPMQWGNFNWDIGSQQGPLEQFISEWQRAARSMHLLGFNEPDGSEQANLTVDQVIEFWPRLERLDLPLVSPVTVSPENAWMTNFMTQALARGCRLDAIAAHNYPGPDGGNPDQLINLLQGSYTDWNRPVWLTEFSTVNWSGTGTWTEEDNYNWLAEFLWRAESLPWLRHYSLFIFTANSTNPTPVNPWDTVGPRSNAYETNGTTPTAFGELYFAWDGDATVREDKAYLIHNKAERKRLRNAVGSTGPGQRWIRDSSSTVQWVLRPSGTAGQWHITSLRDGRRLRNTGGALDFAPPHTTGAGLQWSLAEDEHGWFYVENPSAPAGGRRLRLTGSTFSMAASTNTSDQVKWRFIVPYAPLETVPSAAPANLAVVAGDGQVVLSWGAATNADFSFYSVYRSTSSGGPYTLIASNLTAPGFTNTSLANGTVYYYAITATDLVGNESTNSNGTVTTPVTAQPPSSLGLASSNGLFAVSWPSTHLGWLLQTQTNGLAPGGWATVTNSAGTNDMAWPSPPSAQAIYFRLVRP
jgi:hypothetical protein